MKINHRIIARLDIKNNTVIKGIQMEGLRVVGKPADMARNYYHQGIDEIIYIDAVASLYGRNSLLEVVQEVSQDVFIPITVGGGIRSVEDVRELLRAGADKVAINTAAVYRPELIRDIAETFGSQCVVASIQAKKISQGEYEAYVEFGRERVDLDLLSWATKVVDLGAGEILLTSIDHDGTQKGFDCDIIKKVSEAVPIPVIASGGAGNSQDLINAIKTGKANAVACGTILHYEKSSVMDLKNEMSAAGIGVRIQ